MYEFATLYTGTLKVGKEEVYCCNYVEGSWAWQDIYYDIRARRFYIYSIEVCGSDLSDERVSKVEPISEEEALSLMDERQKAYLKYCIEHYVE